VTAIAILRYLRAVTGGISAAIWRTLTGRICPCEHCGDHRAFIRGSAATYRAEVLGLPANKPTTGE
jgi:hypothetical protein